MQFYNYYRKILIFKICQNSSKFYQINKNKKKIRGIFPKDITCDVIIVKKAKNSIALKITAEHHPLNLIVLKGE